VTDRRTQGTMLLAVGAMAAFLGRSDLTLSYVRAGIRPLLLASGLVLLALGAAALLTGTRGRGAEGADRAPTEGSGGAGAPAAGADGAGAPAGGTGAGHDRGHGAHGASRIGWLLVLPVLVLILVAPPALGSYAAGRRAPASGGGGDQGSMPPVGAAVDGAVPMDLSEFTYRALYDERHSLNGVRVRLLGFVAPNHGDGYLLARFAMYCCAADAEVVEVTVHGDPVKRAADQWLEVEGRVVPSGKLADPGASNAVPVLVADTVRPVAPPKDRYEHSLFGF
jgi:uncharacterized repeat protein (TIGR03943 family)